MVLRCPMKSGRLAWVIKAQQPQEQRYPFLQVAAVFSRVIQTVVWLPIACKSQAGLKISFTVRERSPFCSRVGRDVGLKVG